MAGEAETTIREVKIADLEEEKDGDGSPREEGEETATAENQAAETEETFEEDEPYDGVIVQLTGRPHRDHVIDQDDILNLRIALETSKTLEEFLEKV